MNTPFPEKDNEFVAWYPLGLTSDKAADIWAQRPTAYYVHIPFCTAICDYCGFAVTPVKRAPISQYLDSLRLEIARYRDAGRLTRNKFVCGHFGGGTPSAISADELISINELIFESFDVTKDAELTVEVNPISFDQEKAEIYARGRVNRISLGVQSFDDDALRVMGRPHRSSDVSDSLASIQRAGFVNFSLDLMYAIPGQSVRHLREDLSKAVDTGATHLSCFRLEIIPLTALKLREASYQIPPRLPPEVVSEMDEIVHETLVKAGYKWYGAFNFARPGYESVHNKIAFVAPQGEYIGFGNSAYSFIDQKIFCNHADIQTYMDALSAGNDPIALATEVSAIDVMARYFILGLKFFRVSRAQFILKFGLEPEEVFGDVLKDLKSRQVLELEDDEYSITSKGRPYVNNVVKEFFTGESRGRGQYPQFVSNLSVEQILRYSKLRQDAKPTAS